MKFFHNHFLLSFLSIAMVLFLLTPSVVKLTHTISEHKHLECNELGKLHIHEVELDCDFEKFNLSPQFQSSLVDLPKNFNLAQYKAVSQLYTFLSYYQELSFALRGPPSNFS